jgi:hypothetical protein
VTSLARRLAARLRPAALLLPVLAPLLVAGCGGLTADQRVAVDKFGAATEALAATAVDTFVKTRRDVVALRTRMLALGSPAVDLADPALDLDGPLDLEPLRRRLQAAVALHDFGRLLCALAHDDSAARIQTAADSFLGNLRRTKTVELSDAKADAIRALAGAVAGFYIESRRKEAVRAAVLDTEQPIRTVIALMKNDFDPEQLEWASALTLLEPAVDTTLKRKIQRLRKGMTWGPDERTLTEADIAVIRRDFEALRGDMKRRVGDLRTVCAEIRKALAEFEAAHTDLHYKIQESGLTITNLDRYYARAREAVRLVKIIRGE